MWSLSIVVIVIAIALIVLYIRSNLRAREWAIFHAKKICKQYHVQLLDDSIVQTQLKIIRTDIGSLGWQRHYTFEYSTDGVDRDTGVLQLFGNKLAHISIFNDNEKSKHSDSAVVQTAVNDNVVELSQFRPKDKE